MPKLRMNIDNPRNLLGQELYFSTIQKNLLKNLVVQPIKFRQSGIEKTVVLETVCYGFPQILFGHLLIGLGRLVLFNCMWIVFHIDIDPHQTRNTENINKINCEEYAQKTKSHGLAPA